MKGGGGPSAAGGAHSLKSSACAPGRPRSPASAPPACPAPRPPRPTAHRRPPTALRPVARASRRFYPRPARRRRRKELRAPAAPRRTMPRIDADLKLDFKDVLLRPKRSSLKSRAEVRLFESRLGGGIFFRVARRGG